MNALAVVLLKANDEKNGFALLQKAYDISQMNVITLRNLGVYYASHGDSIKAQELFYKAKLYGGA